MHVEGLSDGRAFLHRLQMSDVHRLRITKEREQLAYLPYKLLTVSSSEEQPVDKPSGPFDEQLRAYQLTAGQRRLWNYPQPLPLPVPLPVPVPVPVTIAGLEEIVGKRSSGDEEDEETNDSKRARLDEVDIVLPLTPVSRITAEVTSISISSPGIPSLEECQAILASGVIGPIAVSYFADFPTNSLPVQQSDYLQTIASCAVIGGAHATVNIVALDCEMCDTTLGCELVRITLLAPVEEVDELCYKGCRVLLDAFVLPAGEVLNYRTEFSGVDASTLKDVTTTLLQAQIAMLRLVSANTILVGHSLDSDLRALHIHHPCCVDTAIVFPHARGFPLRKKLRHLALDCLQMTIQSDKQGHDSREDALAALQLMTMKVEKGESFGMASAARRSIMRRYADAKVRSLFVTASGAAEEDSHTTTKEDAGDNGKTTASAQRSSGKGFHYGLEDAVDGDTALLRVTHAAVPDTLTSFLQPAAPAGSINLADAKSLSDLSALTKEHDGGALVCVSLTCSAEQSDEHMSAQIKALQESLKQKVGHHGLLIVSTQGHAGKAQDLVQRKRSSQKPLSAITWNNDMEKKLKAEIGAVNSGFIAMAVI